jgi:hypothetical protein
MILKNLLFYKIILVLSLSSFAFIPPPPDEGMFPLPMIRQLNLNEAGLKIPVNEIYNPNEPSLIDALVRVDGCTGSFVSPDGLILTNHHCSFGAVQRVSTTEQNYLENGFKADSREDEIPAAGLTCRITVDYEDVSARVLSAANKENDFAARSEAIIKIRKEIEAEAEKMEAGIKAEVAEMFAGESYILFKYQTINDVRLVYIPPRSIGEFGGETDNWMWPRHTGDFSFLRAYVAPDGSPASYSPDNVPYKPKKHLQVEANGASENDFVFLLGYPGRTFKHQPSFFLEYQNEILLPYISTLYNYIIRRYEEYGEEDPEFALSTATFIKSMANVAKNYRGKLQGIKRLNLIERRKDEERKLQEFINNNNSLNKNYGSLLPEIEQVYDDKISSGRRALFFTNLSTRVSLYRLAENYIHYLEDIQKPDNERRDRFKEANLPFISTTLNSIYRNYREEVDKDVFYRMLLDASEAPELAELQPVSNLLKNGRESEVGIKNFINNIYSGSIVTDFDKFVRLFELDNDEALNDPLINFAKEIEELEKIETQREREREGKLNILLPQYMSAKREWQQKTFVPDANSTLRLTYGYVKGYNPADAVYYSPFTTRKGVIEKASDEGDYYMEKEIAARFAEKDNTRFIKNDLKDVPVALLYNTDTSGGNSGSPILNAEGKVVGVNFDRVFEATINDFTWSEQYSRSIGVDIRYILWVTEKIGGADNLLHEMGIK